MGNNMVGRIIQIVLLCFVVGVVLAAFNTDALGLLNWIVDNFQKVVDSAAELVDWGGHYILLGAGLVLPIVAINFLIKYFRDRGPNNHIE
ncbi:hypothetical protein [Kiloniella sp. EL199]|uniref:hypothetical protein n=1 Tax=Kiloniella sp. EL199 TaxID=2107581 RepID=UPI0013C40ED4|nr:hypothetical protein [Kiloniella sp. EL199]